MPETAILSTCDVPTSTICVDQPLTGKPPTPTANRNGYWDLEDGRYGCGIMLFKLQGVMLDHKLIIFTQNYAIAEVCSHSSFILLLAS